MSVAIEIDDVYEVLLADGWHEVSDDSFELDSYEYVSGSVTRFGGGHDKLLPATGFRFVNRQKQFTAGPLTSIIAVRIRRSTERS